MPQLGLDREVTHPEVRDRTALQFARAGVSLPTLSQLADPATIPAALQERLTGVDPDARDPLNLFRVHWFNGPDRRTRVDVPGHVVLPSALTGVASPIIVVFGYRFPMIRAHKVLAAYGCLVPRLVTGQFDPERHRAIWPSTGNYCRGGVAISRVLGCHGVAVLPEGMSAERFEWLDRWVLSPEDIVRTPGSESNVKEIYDACHELERDPQNIVFNQFCEFGNHLVHFHCTGRALGQAFEHVRAQRPGLRLAAFVSATGSAGTIGAGDRLKDEHGTQIVAAEALECPTMLYNGYGEHNIQGIGDKHVPLVHNVMNTDVAVAVSDRATDSLNFLFNTDAGREFLVDEQGLDEALIAQMEHFGFSSLCNVLGAIKTARKLGLGPDDAIVTVATDGAELYATEIEKARERLFPRGFDRDAAAAVFREYLADVTPEHTEVLGDVGRRRIFNLGYYTWVEQQGVPLDEFEARRSQDFWRGLRELIPVWDGLIEEFNERAHASA